MEMMQMAYLTLSFHGLCAFVEYTMPNDGKNSYDVFLPTHMEHRAVLMARTEFIGSGTDWEPDFIGGVQTGQGPGNAKVDQVAGWNLTGRTTFSGQSSGQVSWPNRASDAIDFRVFHDQGYQVMIPNNGDPVVDLPGGTGSCPASHHITLTKRNGRSVTNGNRNFGTVVEWQGLPTVMQNDRGQKIEFVTDQGPRDPFATVTNVAASNPAQKAAGLTHFSAYYMYVQLMPGDDELQLAAGLGEVYDCVPPGGIS
jgi:hypothetical protein